MADTNWGEGYRGGYGGGVSLQDIEGGIRDATSTFINYVSGTVQLVFMIAFVFMFISILTLCLMIYARYVFHKCCFDLTVLMKRPSFYYSGFLLWRYVIVGGCQKF